MKKVSRKEVLRKPWNGATLPKWEFYEKYARKMVLKEKEEHVFSKNFGD
jgi:hypothetical protein